MTTAQVAEAVTLQLATVVSAHPGSEIGRAYVPRKELKDLTGILITVLGTSRERRRLTRKVTERDHVVEIGLQLQVADVAACDAAGVILDEIEDTLYSADPTGLSLLNTTTAVYSPEDLDEDGVYTGVVMATYRELRG